MTGGELATRWTIRLALICCSWGAWFEMSSGKSERRLRSARAAWTLGWALFLAHLGCAFQFYHHWSHTEAYLHTARRTVDLLGWNWGGGIYFNYALTAAWTLDTLGWWCRPVGRRLRAGVPLIAWRGFFVFMVVNATIVFGSGLVRWASVAALSTLGLIWMKSFRKAPAS